ncbi:PDDEXK nuclease domain-containing protein [Mucilaginibacter ginsenosidivorax]|uniref:DUF1016 domain-containing protein n=1 Tax=Mucilaginibacter ginsenosidivorax TaxID=862126 RepID=A0A5B8VWF5_9SPHI|nr:PDDEXK nuclease domain-containing protein [Mucilaginibacter ginsenosidivorax]QEC75870.1 DUF1016 domain-containing protein [Mucilaginibacter ginsenosidivorax]
MNVLPESYKDTLIALKNKIRRAQTKIVLTANVQLLAIYWEIGEFICHIEKQKDWGSKIIDQISADLKDDFPELKGLSPRNLRYMRNFFVNWPQLSLLRQNGIAVDNLILQQPVAKLPWGHICILNDRIKSDEERNFYAAKTAENNWSRNVLLNQIDSGLFIRQGKLLNNFTHTLPLLQGDLAKELFKDPYKFDFFHLSEEAKERDLENALIADIQKFLLELGKGFAFVGRQFKIDKGDSEYFLDLLFYHTKLHCYIVLELKTGEFKPEYAGKMNFYLSVIDEHEKASGDNPSIGIILCKSKNKITAEYTLRDMNKPMGIAEYNLTDAIPTEIKAELPSIEDLENELEKSVKLNQKPYEKQLDKMKTLISNLNHEELREKVSNQAIYKLFTELLPQIVSQAEIILNPDIYSLFDYHSISRTINNNDFEYNTSIDLEMMMIQGDVQQVGLTINLKGFKKAGVETFSVFQTFLILFSDYFYEIGTTRRDVWRKYLYHEILNDNDISYIVDKWVDKIINDINERIAAIAKKHIE